MQNVGSSENDLASEGPNIWDNIPVYQNYAFACHPMCWSRNVAADGTCIMHLKTFP